MMVFLQAVLGAIGPQSLPPAGCAAFLWTRDQTPQLVGMLVAEPGRLRLNVNGRTLDLPRAHAEGATARGFPGLSRYAAGDVVASIELVAADRSDLADGALVEEATLTLTRADADTTVVPLGGLIGCAPAGARR